jgi:hypothetical protein
MNYRARLLIPKPVRQEYRQTRLAISAAEKSIQRSSRARKYTSPSLRSQRPSGRGYGRGLLTGFRTTWALLMRMRSPDSRNGTSTDAKSRIFSICPFRGVVGRSVSSLSTTSKRSSRPYVHRRGARRTKPKTVMRRGKMAKAQQRPRGRRSRTTFFFWISECLETT